MREKEKSSIQNKATSNKAFNKLESCEFSILVKDNSIGKNHLNVTLSSSKKHKYLLRTQRLKSFGATKGNSLKNLKTLCSRASVINWINRQDYYRSRKLQLLDRYYIEKFLYFVVLFSLIKTNHRFSFFGFRDKK